VNIVEQPAPADETDNPLRSLPAVDGILSRLKDRARARHDVTVDEIQPGALAVASLAFSSAARTDATGYPCNVQF
jgi:hypothetical protein